MTFKKRREFEVGIDGRKDVLASVREMTDFIQAVARQWKKVRTHYFRGMPSELVYLLDEASDILVCEEKGCLVECHPEWDFCREHGERKEETPVIIRRIIGIKKNLGGKR